MTGAMFALLRRFGVVVALASFALVAGTSSARAETLTIDRAQELSLRSGSSSLARVPGRLFVVPAGVKSRQRCASGGSRPARRCGSPPPAPRRPRRGPTRPPAASRDRRAAPALRMGDSPGRADRAESPGPGSRSRSSTQASTRPTRSSRPAPRRPCECRSRGRPGRGSWNGGCIGPAAPVDGLGPVGVYPQAPLQVWDASPPDGIPRDVIPGLDTAVAAGPSVLNLSLGSPARSPGARRVVPVTRPLRHARRRSRRQQPQRGIPLVSREPSARADGRRARPRQRAATFSSGSSPSTSPHPARHPVAIPGPTPPTPLRLLHGTSFASPLVAAAAAWVLTMRPSSTLTPAVRRDAPLGEGRRRARLRRPQPGFGILDIPAALADPAAGHPDPQEPNDDIDQVKANRVFQQAKEPINGPRAAAPPGSLCAARPRPTTRTTSTGSPPVPARRQATVSPRRRRRRRTQSAALPRSHPVAGAAPADSTGSLPTGKVGRPPCA